MILEFIKAHKLIFTAFMILLVGLIVFISYTIMTRIGKEPVTVRLIPNDARLVINGEQIREGTAYLKPGMYTFEASRDGFETVKRSVIVGKPNSAEIDVALTPISDSAIKWQNENKKLYFEYEGRAGVHASQKGEVFTAVNPITSRLPYDTLLYTIGYRADPSDTSGNSIIIEIDAMSGYRNAAIKKIRDFGFNPTNFKIIFRDYESPFDHE